MNIIIFIITNIIENIFVWVDVLRPDYQFSAMPGWSYSEYQFSGSLLEACSSKQHIYIAALVFHPLSSGFMVYLRTTMSNILACFIFCFSYFQFLEQELSFDYDSSSSFLTLNMKCISYFIYVQIICISFSPLFL